MSKGRVMIMAGGTGGHVYPALALAEALRGRGCEVFWLGVPGSFEARVVPAAGIAMEWIEVQGLRGTGLVRVLIAPVKLLRALAASLRILRRLRPALVVGMGGFVTGPGGLAARLLGVPLLIHEQNRIPGLTNRILARIAKRVCQAFPDSFPPALAPISLGNPVRAAILAVPPKGEINRPPHLLVVGGSLGAQALNQSLAEILAGFPAGSRPKVRHQAGRNKLEQATEAYRKANVEAEVTEFIDDIAEAYAWADLVICRSGALTVSELAAVGRASVLVPYPHAVDDHQTANAHYLADGGAALIAQQRDFPDALRKALQQLLAEPARLLTMAERARALALTDATERTAALCMETMQA